MARRLGNSFTWSGVVPRSCQVGSGKVVCDTLGPVTLAPTGVTGVTGVLGVAEELELAMTAGKRRGARDHGGAKPEARRRDGWPVERRLVNRGRPRRMREQETGRGRAGREVGATE